MIARHLALRLLTLLVVFFVALPAAAQAPPVALPAGVQFVTNVEGINEYRLPNGLRVLLFADPTKTNVTVNVTYMVGSRHENYGETGMAHLLEHLLFKGSKNHPNIPKELTDHGARPNGTTWVDRTNYFETFTATDENLTWALDLEADRMVNSFIAKKDLDSEMTVVRNEFEAGENDPQSVLMSRAISTAFLWHNYGNDTIGARSDIERVPIDRLQAFYRHFYQPDNATLVVAGKFDEAKTLALVQQKFGAIPKPERELRRTYTTEPTQDGERSLVLRRVGDVQSVCAVYHVPPGAHQEFAAIEVAGAILGDQPSGRLYKALVESQKAASVAAFTFQWAESGVFLAGAEVRMEKSLDEARTTLTGVLDTLTSQPFTDEEVERIKTQQARAFDLLLNNSERVALRLSEYQAMGDWRLMFLHRDRLKTVTRAEVQAAAAKYFIPSNRTIAEFRPEKSPLRAEIPGPPDVMALLMDYKGGAAVARGEEFDASPSNIDARTTRADAPGGLKLTLLPKKTRGEDVNALVVLRFGTEASLKGKREAAAAAGTLLSRGTAKRTRQQIKDEFDRLKAQVSISGGATQATASIQTMRANLKPVLDLVAEVLKEASFPADEFEKWKQEELAGLENQKSEPQSMAIIPAQRHLNPYPEDDVRYVATIDEQIEAVKALTLDQVKAFHKQFYGASAGEVVIVGDVDAAAAQAQVASLFGTWKSPGAFARVRRMHQAVPSTTAVFEAPDKANAFWIAALPLKMTDADPDYPALTLANYLLGSGFNSRLFARIRGKEGLSYRVGSQFQAGPEDDGGMFLAFAISAPENGPKVEAAFKDEFAQIAAKGFTAEEVEAAKKSWAQQRQVSRANDRELVRTLDSQRFWNRTMAWDAGLETKVQALTAEQVTAAFKKYLQTERMSYFRAGDFKAKNVTW